MTPLSRTCNINSSNSLCINQLLANYMRLIINSLYLDAERSSEILARSQAMIRGFPIYTTRDAQKTWRLQQSIFQLVFTSHFGMSTIAKIATLQKVHLPFTVLTIRDLCHVQYYGATVKLSGNWNLGRAASSVVLHGGENGLVWTINIQYVHSKSEIR